MTVEFSDAQLRLLTEIISEYRDFCYSGMLELQNAALNSDDKTIARENAAMAKSEEERFRQSGKLLEYIEKYAELMRSRDS